MAELPKYVQKLIEIYQKAQLELIKTIAEKEIKGNVTSYKKSLLSQVMEQLKILDNQAKVWTREVIPNRYKKGTDDAITALKGYYPDIEYNSFNGLNTDAVEALVKSTYGDLHDANNFIGSRIMNAVEQAVFNATAQKLAQGLTLKEFRKNLINSLIDEGFNGFKDKRGRMISLEAYASTVARSSVREATNRAMLNQLSSMGCDLVKMSSHNTSCPVCAVYQGRVYSISGNDKRYPKLDIAFSGTHANIHPNCSHFLTPYIEAFAKDPEGDRNFSNSDFDVDPRSQKDIDNYNNRQREKTRLRNDKEQWQNYKLALPNECPKDFTAFQKMKNGNSEIWQSLQENYRLVTNKSSIIRTEEDFRNELKNGGYSIKINEQKQKRHLPDTHEEGKSILTVDAQELVNNCSGTGRIIIQSGNQPPKEVIANKSIVGKYFNRSTGKYIETNKAMIVYSKTGIHVYPIE